MKKKLNINGRRKMSQKPRNPNRFIMTFEGHISRPSGDHPIILITDTKTNTEYIAVQNFHVVLLNK